VELNQVYLSLNGLAATRILKDAGPLFETALDTVAGQGIEYCIKDMGFKPGAFNTSLTRAQ
jgi:hypothetical protein